MNANHVNPPIRVLTAKEMSRTSYLDHLASQKSNEMKKLREE